MPGSNRSADRVQIVVDSALNTGNAEYANVGDVAMLQVAVKRLLELWPSARVDVLTESATNLALFCPGATALSRLGRDAWIDDEAILGSVSRLLPKALRVSFASWRRALRLRYPDVFRRLMRNRKGETDAFLQALHGADLFMICGAGGFTDSSREWSSSALKTLEEAIQRDVPTAMLGQGIGPLNDKEISAHAREVLPKVCVFSLRGNRGGEELAQSFGLSSKSLLITGDEAVELAYEARTRDMGKAIGVNLRVTSYSQIDAAMMDKLRPTLHEFARRRRVSLLPVPIAFHEWAEDRSSIAQLLKGFDDRSDGGIDLDTPAKVIQQIGRCRIVVTGAYHAAVFALSQGIPVIGLSASEDYTKKFLGLEDQFGLGCETVFLEKPNFPEELEVALEKSWRSAEEVRLPLLEAARRQIALSRQAYDQVRDLVNARKATTMRAATRTRSSPVNMSSTHL